VSQFKNYHGKLWPPCVSLHCSVQLLMSFLHSCWILLHFWLMFIYSMTYKQRSRSSLNLVCVCVLRHDFYCVKFVVWTGWCYILVLQFMRDCVCCSCWLGLHSTSFCHKWDYAPINSKSELMSCIKIGSKDIPVSKLSGYRLELLYLAEERIFPFLVVSRISCFIYPITSMYSELWIE
jgi:hypothetical protein